jgi:hypothetical protein
MNQEIQHEYADLGDVRLHYVTAGQGPAVILLHGCRSPGSCGGTSFRDWLCAIGS